MGGMICRELLEEKRKEVTPLLFHYFLVTWKADLMKTSNCCGFPKVFSPTCKTPSPIRNPKCSIWTQRNEEWKQHHQYWTLLLVDMNSLLWAPWCTRATCQDTTQRSAICWSIKMLMPLHVDGKLRAWCKLGPKSVIAGREKKQGIESWVLQSPFTLWVLNSNYKCRNLPEAETKKTKMATKCKHSPLSYLLPHKTSNNFTVNTHDFKE